MTTDKAARIAENAEALYEALDGMMGIVDDAASVGVFQLNGAVAHWSEFYSGLTLARNVLRRIENATNPT